MKRIVKMTCLIIFTALVGVTIFGMITTSKAFSRVAVSPGDYSPNEIIIKLKNGERLQNSYSIATNINTGIESLDELNNKFGVSKMEKIVTEMAGYSISSADIRFPRSSLLYQVEMLEDQNIMEAISEYEKIPEVEYAEPNYIQRIAATPDDTYFNDQWGLHNTGQTGGEVDADIDAPEAWDITTGDDSITVAVIDSGIDGDHPDLAASIVEGWDYVDGDADPDDLNDHGTHVAGIIGAIGNNSVGITGVSWNVKIMPLRVFDADGSGYTSDFILALDQAVADGVKIVNYSGGGPSYSQAAYDAIADAMDNDVLLVAAAGNDTINNDDGDHNYPSDYDLDNILSVAATDDGDDLASFSNYGVVSIDVAAPGVSIYSTVPDDDYGYMNGTSMATPMVTGLAVLLKSYNSDYTFQGIKNNIIANVDEVSYLRGKILSGGRINANSSLVDIDEQVPTATVSYDVTEWTDQDIVATLVPSETVVVTNNEGLETYTFTENGSFTFEFTDLAGNPGSAIATVSNIDKLAPTDPTSFVGYTNNSKMEDINLTATHPYQSPYFGWSGAADAGIGLKGYYVNFSVDIEADALDGSFQTGNYYTSSSLIFDDTYYLHIKTVDDLDNVSDGTYTAYIYQPSRYIITGPKKGGGPDVRVFTPSGDLVSHFMAYESTFRGGINVAVGDIDGNGINEIITSTREGGAPTIRVFDVSGNNLGWDFDAYDSAFRGGINIAVGDIEGDGPNEIAVAPISSGGPNIRIFGLRDDQIVPTTENFLAYDENFRGGVAISIGDIEGDGLGEIITTPTSRGGPHVRVFGVRQKRYVPVTLGVMAYAEDFRGGINSCMGDVDNDGQDEIMTGIVSAGGPHVRIIGMQGVNQGLALESPGFMAFDSSLRGGVSVTTMDTFGDGYEEIITGIGGDEPPLVRIYDSEGILLFPEFLAYTEAYTGGLTLAAGFF